jgi:hypothetical protein
MNNLLTEINTPEELDDLLSKIKPFREQVMPVIEAAHIFNCCQSHMQCLYKRLNELQINNPEKYSNL